MRARYAKLFIGFEKGVERQGSGRQSLTRVVFFWFQTKVEEGLEFLVHRTKERIVETE